MDLTALAWIGRGGFIIGFGEIPVVLKVGMGEGEATRGRREGRRGGGGLEGDVGGKSGTWSFAWIGRFAPV